MASERGVSDNLARKRRVEKLRAQWREDKASGRLREVQRPPSRPHPSLDDPLLRGVPKGCTGSFVLQDCADPLRRGDAIASALEEDSKRRGHGLLKSIPELRYADAVRKGGDDFFNTYPRKGIPVVVHGCEGYDDESTWSPTALARVYGDRAWAMRRGKDYGSLESVTTTLSDYLEYLSDEIPIKEDGDPYFIP